MEKIMYELLFKALFGKRVDGLGDEYYMAAKKMDYIIYSEFDKNNPELTEKGHEKLQQLKNVYNPTPPKKGKGGYEVNLGI